MAKFIVKSDDLFQQLYDAGAITAEPRSVRRVIIDLKAGHIAVFYVEGFLDDEKLAAGLEAGLTLVEPNTGKERDA